MLKRICLLALLLLVAAAFSASGTNGPLTSIEKLGKFLFFDKISVPNSMSCAECHAPSVGFTGPTPGINAHGAVYRGAVPQRFGNRKPPSAAYATLSPIFHFDEEEALFIGGNFWDGRATGEKLGNPAADQALGPFLNPVEMNNPSKLAVLKRVAASHYIWLWQEVWGEPLQYSTPAQIDLNYDRVGLAIAAYEGSSEVNQFSSKFDEFWKNALDAGKSVPDINMMNWQDYLGLGLTKKETMGLALFNDENKGKCSLCHVLVPPGGDMNLLPLFTDYSFDNLGVPKNPENPFYRMDKVYLDDGSPINPLGADWIDLGLGGFLMTRPEWQAMAAENYGRHKVPTLRNVDKRPGEEFPKAYMHNGYFKSLKEVVHFYNTRDVETWPPPEVPETVNTEELGNLGLTKAEENAIVAFMGTLSDGYSYEMVPQVSVERAGPSTASLRVVGPNPFNPSTAISYYLPKADNVRMQVFDVSGRKVATLVDGWNEAGEHRVEFTATNLTSGVYFVRFLSGTENLTTKLVLLR
jgi:cytochrome c peroxidase